MQRTQSAIYSSQSIQKYIIMFHHLQAVISTVLLSNLSSHTEHTLPHHNNIHHPRYNILLQHRHQHRRFHHLGDMWNH